MEVEIRKRAGGGWHKRQPSRMLVGMSSIITVAASMAAVAIVLVLVGAPAAAGKDPGIDLRMLVIGSGGKKVLAISGKTRPPVISRGTIKISRKLCEGGYRLAVTFPELHGLHFNATATIHGARLNGQPRPCPFAGLPPRDLRSLKVLVIINDKTLMNVSARPRTRAGETFERLNVVKKPQYHIEALLPGRAELRVQGRYRTGRVYVITLLADIGYEARRSSS